MEGEPTAPSGLPAPVHSRLATSFPPGSLCPAVSAPTAIPWALCPLDPCPPSDLSAKSPPRGHTNYFLRSPEPISRFVCHCLSPPFSLQKVEPCRIQGCIHRLRAHEVHSQRPKATGVRLGVGGGEDGSDSARNVGSRREGEKTATQGAALSDVHVSVLKRSL